MSPSFLELFFRSSNRRLRFSHPNKPDISLPNILYHPQIFDNRLDENGHRQRHPKDQFARSLLGVGTDTFQVQTIRPEPKNVPKDAEQDYSRIYRKCRLDATRVGETSEAKDRAKSVLHEKSYQQANQEDQGLCSAKNSKKAQDSRRGDC